LNYFFKYIEEETSDDELNEIEAINKNILDKDVNSKLFNSDINNKRSSPSSSSSVTIEPKQTHIENKASFAEFFTNITNNNSNIQLQQTPKSQQQTVFQAASTNSSSNTSSHNNTTTSGEGSNDNINNFHVNQYYYHVQNLKQQETSLVESSPAPTSPPLTTTMTTTPSKEITPVAAIDLVNRTNYMIPHQKTDRVVTVKNKSITSNSKNMQKLQLHEAQQKSKLKNEKKSNSKIQNPRTISTDNSLISTLDILNINNASSPPLAQTQTTAAAVVNELNALSPSKANNKLVNLATQQISSLKLNRSVSSDNELMNQEAMRQPSRVSAKIQQLLNTLKVRLFYDETY